MQDYWPKQSINFNENELFSVIEQTTTTFLDIMSVCCHYVLTLVIYENEEALLVLTAPGFSGFSSLEITNIKQVVQIIFSDFLIEFFRKKPFNIIGELLQQSAKGLVFPKEIAFQAKDKIFGLAIDKNLNSGMDFFAVMLFLAESKYQVIFPEKENIPVQSYHNLYKIKKVQDYVKDNFRKQIKVNEVAALVHLSEDSFSRFFKKVTGVNFISFVNQIRIEKSVVLLQKTDDSISGIAYNCGFSTPAYFNEVFKQIKGLTPGEFRSMEYGPMLERI